MATITKRVTQGGVKFTAQIRRKGVSESKTFSSMTRARLWAAQRESELTDIAEGQIPRHTLGEAFERYSKEVSPQKRGGRWEKIRLDALPNTGQQLLKTNLPLQSVLPALLAQWRDARMLEVTPGTVLRELGLLSAVFQRCVREWGWMRENPVKAIAKPPAPPHRDKLLTRAEIRKVLRQLTSNKDTTSARIGIAFLFALRTGMRAGEICGLRWHDIDDKTAFLPNTKNGTARHVPLSRKANLVLRRLYPAGKNRIEIDDKSVFGLTPGTLDALFRRARTRAGLSGFTFHDSRHHFCTYAARKLTPFELARVMGHKDLKMTMRYYNESASNIAAKLDK